MSADRRRTGMTCLLVLAGVAVSLHPVLAHGTAPRRVGTRHAGGNTLMAAHQWPRATLGQKTAAFTVEHGTAPGVFEYLFNRDHLIIGIELIQPPAKPDGAPPPSLEQIPGPFGPGTLRAVLDEVVARDPALLWVADHDVANLVYRANFEDPNYVFNRIVPSFDADDLPYYRAVQALFVIVYRELGGTPAAGGLRHDPDSEPRVTIHLQQATMRRILNEIAWQAGLGWRVMYKPGDQMMGILLASEFTLDSDCEQTLSASIQPPAPPVITHLDDAPDTPEPLPSALLPLRDSLTQRGFAVGWNPARREASASKGSIRLNLAPGATVAHLNGVPVALPTRPVLREGRLLVPCALIALLVGAEAGWASALPSPAAGSLSRS